MVKYIGKEKRDYMNILLTGFSTFGPHENNPTSILIQELRNRRNENIEILQLDVGYEQDGKTVIEKIKEIEPDIVLSFGLAGGRYKVCFEAIALNVRNSLITDNQGMLCSHQKIGNGPLAYESTINYKELEKSLSLEDFAISYHAGTFVCNDVYYQELEYINLNHLNIQCGFIHIPYVEEFTKQIPSIKWERLIDITMRIIDKILEEYNV